MQLALLQVSVSLALVLKCTAEVFTAMADMEHILGVEKTIGNVIEQYIESEQRRLQKLQEFAKEYEIKNSKDLTMGMDYIANPINAYMVIKRLSNDWGQVERLMRSNMAEDFLSNITTQRQINQVKFPTSEDLTGAATALMRLQDTYRLDTRDIASGKIKGAANADAMDGISCFELGRSAYNQNDYYHTVMWMQEALNRIEHENPPTIEASEVLEYLAFSLYQQGNLKRALSLTKQLVKLDPDHPRAEGNVKWYEDQLKSEGFNPSDLTNLPPVSNPRSNDASVPERNDYERLCRGEVVMSPKEQAKYYCYFKRDHPYLFLAPIKVEIVKLNPMAVLFRELNRATVFNRESGKLESASYRISKSAWLKEEDHPVVRRVNARIGLMTNLEMETAEDLQIANYGLGGHYDVHFDHARKEETNAFKGLGTGNRIATNLFYMTDVEAGGATVFPLLNAAVFPEKGSALFWYNLWRDGEGDHRTRHAACPVLSGQKWVSNKWIHERGQEWKRPCNLKSGEYANEEFVGELSDYNTRYWEKL